MAVAPVSSPRSRTSSPRAVAAPYHQHLFCARLDLDVDGSENSVYEVDVEPRARRSRQPVGQRVPSGGDAPRVASRPRNGDTNAATQPGVEGRATRRGTNRLGQPVGLQARAHGVDADAARRRRSRASRQRAGFARHNLWVTPYAPRRATRGRRLPQPARRRRRAPALDRGRPLDRRHRRRALVHVRRHARRSGRRTGPSCPSSTRGSCSRPSASSTATPPSTSHRRALTAPATPRADAAQPAPHTQQTGVSSARSARRTDAPSMAESAHPGLTTAPARGDRGRRRRGGLVPAPGKGDCR